MDESTEQSTQDSAPPIGVIKHGFVEIKPRKVQKKNPYLVKQSEDDIAFILEKKAKKKSRNFRVLIEPTDEERAAKQAEREERKRILAEAKEKYQAENKEYIEAQTTLVRMGLADLEGDPKRRCLALSRRFLRRCKMPAEKGRTTCRLHGGRSIVVTEEHSEKKSMGKIRPGAVMSRFLSPEEANNIDYLRATLRNVDDELVVCKIRLQRYLVKEKEREDSLEVDSTTTDFAGNVMTTKRVKDYGKDIDRIIGRIESLEGRALDLSTRLNSKMLDEAPVTIVNVQDYLVDVIE